jgi:hypothetical protein
MSRRLRARAVARHAGLIWPWLLAGALGCRSAAPSGAEGRLSVRWTGPDTATFSSRAVAEWCASLHLLEIRAIAGDSGIGLVLYPADSVQAGAYPVRRPNTADTARSPSAAVALRWFSKTAILGYQADTGRVTVERTPDGSLAGRFAIGARPLVTGARLNATGTFEDIRIMSAPPACAGRAPGDTTGRDSTGAGEPEPDSSD